MMKKFAVSIERDDNTTTVSVTHTGWDFAAFDNLAAKLEPMLPTLIQILVAPTPSQKAAGKSDA